MAKDKQKTDEKLPDTAPVVSGQPPVDDNTLQPPNSETQPETVVVVVLRGKTVHHNGTHYQENQQIQMEPDDADYLMKAGFVDTLEGIHERAAAIASGGVVIETGSHD
ncbi:MAG: hypothetical protein ACRC5A_05985 [Enterobacteriaceae bacterium]